MNVILMRDSSGLKTYFRDIVLYKNNLSKL